MQTEECIAAALTEAPTKPLMLAERLVLSTTAVEDWVLDPFAGVGSALVAAVRHGRRAAGAEIDGEYVAIAKGRIHQASAGCVASSSEIYWRI